MKVIKTLLVSLFALFLVATPVFGQQEVMGKQVVKPEVVDSYDLFWPIVAGKVEGESMYFLKNLKESIRGKLVFSNFKKSEYYLLLSEKRTVEAEKLLVVLKDYGNAEKTLNAAQKNREKVVDSYLSAGEEGINTTGLKSRTLDSFQKQKKVLNYLLSIVPDDAKAIIKDNVTSLDSSASKIQ